LFSISCPFNVLPEAGGSVPLCGPRQWRGHHGWVDLVVDLLLHSGLGSVFVHAVVPNPAQHLLLRQIGVGREGAGRCRHRASGVDAAGVGAVSARAGPVANDYGVGVLLSG